MKPRFFKFLFYIALLTLLTIPTLAEVYRLETLQTVQAVMPYSGYGAPLSPNEKSNILRFVHGRTKLGASIVFSYTPECYRRGSDPDLKLSILPSRNTGSNFYYNQTITKSYKTADFDKCETEVNILNRVAPESPVELTLDAGTFRLAPLSN